MFYKGIPEKALFFFATPPPRQLSRRTRLLSAPGIVYALRRNHAQSVPTSVQLSEEPISYQIQKLPERNQRAPLLVSMVSYLETPTLY